MQSYYNSRVERASMIAPLCHCGQPVKFWRCDNNRKFPQANGQLLMQCGGKNKRCKMNTGYAPFQKQHPEGSLHYRVNFQAAIHPKTKADCIAVRLIQLFHTIVSEQTGAKCLAILSAAEREGERITVEGLEGGELFVHPFHQYRPLLEQFRPLGSVIVIAEIPQVVLEAYEQNLAKENMRSITPQRPSAGGGPAVVDVEAPSQAQPQRLSIANEPLFADLMDFQRRGVDFILLRGGKGMITDEMGLGKTVQAIGVLHMYRHEWPAVVLCPPSLCYNWLNEISKWCSIPASRIIILKGRSPKTMEDISGASIVIVGYPIVESIANLKFDVGVVDESHYIKTPKAKRTAAATQVLQKCKRLVLLSGTPTLAKPCELFTQLRLIEPSILSSDAAYYARYCNVYRSVFGGNWNADGHANIQELQFLMRRLMIRRTKKEVLKQLPDKIREIVYLEVSEKDAKKMKDAMKRKQAETGGKDLKAALNQKSSFELHQLTAEVKVSGVKAYMEDLLNTMLDDDDGDDDGGEDETKEMKQPPKRQDPLKGGKTSGSGSNESPTTTTASSGRSSGKSKVLFFAFHRNMLNAIEELVSKKYQKKLLDYIRIDGDTDKKQVLVDHFQRSPKCRVAILSTEAAGVGLNFTSGNQVIFGELVWTPSTLLQCEDRIHRIGQDERCIIKYLLANNTLDDVMWPMVQAKLQVTNAVLSDDMTHHEEVALDRCAAITSVPAAPSGGPSNSGNAGAQHHHQQQQGTLDAWFGGGKANAASIAGAGGGVHCGSTAESPQLGLVEVEDSVLGVSVRRSARIAQQQLQANGAGGGQANSPSSHPPAVVCIDSEDEDDKCDLHPPPTAPLSSSTIAVPLRTAIPSARESSAHSDSVVILEEREPVNELANQPKQRHISAVQHEETGTVQRSGALAGKQTSTADRSSSLPSASRVQQDGQGESVLPPPLDVASTITTDAGNSHREAVTAVAPANPGTTPLVTSANPQRPRPRRTIIRPTTTAVLPETTSTAGTCATTSESPALDSAVFDNKPSTIAGTSPMPIAPLTTGTTELCTIPLPDATGSSSAPNGQSHGPPCIQQAGGNQGQQQQGTGTVTCTAPRGPAKRTRTIIRPTTTTTTGSSSSTADPTIPLGTVAVGSIGAETATRCLSSPKEMTTTRRADSKRERDDTAVEPGWGPV